MDSAETYYIVYDIETVPDGPLLADVLYPELGLSPDEAIARQEAEVMEVTDGRSTFVPSTFQFPVAIAVARLSQDFHMQKAAILDAPHYRTREMVELFWKGVEAYPKATLVDFGGRHFDLPVLELCAFRYGITVPDYFAPENSKKYRHRWSNQHIDLLEWFTNWGACRLKGGLNLLAKMIGKPGKMDVKGELVLDLWREGKKERIGSYCLCDVLDTYFVFLRSRVMRGEISAQEEKEIEGLARGLIEDIAFDDPNVEEYLNRWQDNNFPHEETTGMESGIETVSKGEIGPEGETVSEGEIGPETTTGSEAET